jgi:hypothetical protein
MIHEPLPSPTETAFGSHPCCVVSVTYVWTHCFHGGNTGSNPVGDANKINYAASDLFHCVLFRVDAARPRLARAFRMAPVSRQTNLKPVWHSPRSHSRPATLPRTPFCPFHRSALFLPAAAQVKEETSRKRQKGKKHEIRRSQPTHQRGGRFSGGRFGVRSQ